MSPSPARSTWLVQKLARLRDAGAVPVSSWTLPTRAFFPGGFEASRTGLDALARRMAELAGLSFLDVRVALCDPETGELVDEVDAASCGTGACGSCGPAPAKSKPAPAVDEAVDEGDDAYRLLVGTDAAGTPLVAASRIARAIGATFLAESDLRRAVPPAERVAVSELAAVSIGFAALVLPAAAMTVRGCGGARQVRATALEIGDLALATELVGSASGFDTSTLDASFDVVVRDELVRARRLVADNRGVARTLRENPTSLLEGIVQLRPRKSLGERLLSMVGRRSVDDEIDALESKLADRRAPSLKAP